MSIKTVSELMTHKVVTLFEEQTLPLAHQLMKEKRFRHLPVIDDDHRLAGVVTHSDILRAQSQAFSLMHGNTAATFEPNVPVRQIMTRDCWTVHHDAPIHQAGQLLLDHSFSCLPVVDENDKLVGIITDRDFLKYALLAIDWGVL